MIRAEQKNRPPSQDVSPLDALPPFKPVAMPALTAAFRPAYREPARKSSVDFPTLLRINAMLERNQN